MVKAGVSVRVGCISIDDLVHLAILAFLTPLRVGDALRVFRP